MNQKNKNVPKWAQDKIDIKTAPIEELKFIGAEKSNIVINGKLPNGDDYFWKKRRK